MNNSLAEIIQRKWRHLASLALIAWDELTLEELIRTQGDAQQLTDLVQQRYDMPREDAQKQVMSFFERHRTT
ncbi:CsbD family protein [Pseudomonas aeruginosa]|uniref:CsbD family protein n=1 Tax=Pseudomonas aeruginosa TaxID=287 RepID=UPI001F4BACD9|nr:general stress protein CsbD [Pseudomonas aeruginosa]HEK0085356.1 general stress protein CsbD [Pseudomonas aeruginosa]HEK0091533.1 general stress protein CsbD [Pseudomonas aeruginosa]HEK1459433.1 general stress protein CsbD [Pseudomonas aeruginosa]